jgi:hypothetical protein
VCGIGLGASVAFAVEVCKEDCHLQKEWPLNNEVGMQLSVLALSLPFCAAFYFELAFLKFAWITQILTSAFRICFCWEGRLLAGELG